MPNQLHPTGRADRQLSFAGNNTVAAVLALALAAVFGYAAFRQAPHAGWLVLAGTGAVILAVAAWLATLRDELSLDLEKRSYRRRRGIGRGAKTDQGSLDEMTSVSLDVRAFTMGVAATSGNAAWVVFLEFKNPCMTAGAAQFSFSARKAYAYAEDLARALRVPFVDKSGFAPRETAWTEIGKPLARPRGAQIRPLPTKARIALGGGAPARTIDLLPGGWRIGSAVLAALAGVLTVVGLGGLINGAAHLPASRGWWVVPAVALFLGLTGLLAAALGGFSRWEIRESPDAIAFAQRLFGLAYRTARFPKSAIIEIEHRIDPIRVRRGLHEVLVRAPGTLLRVREFPPSNAELEWLREALLAWLSAP